jgi:hypothetical protein
MFNPVSIIAELFFSDKTCMGDLVLSIDATGSAMWTNMGMTFREIHPQMSAWKVKSNLGKKYLNVFVFM